MLQFQYLCSFYLSCFVLLLLLASLFLLLFSIFSVILLVIILHLKHLHQVYTDIQTWQREFSMNIEFPNFLKHELPCNQPLDMVFLLSNGEMMACCSAIFHGHGHRFSLGNLSNYAGSFSKLWNQPSMQKFRRARFRDGDGASAHRIAVRPRAPTSNVEVSAF